MNSTTSATWARGCHCTKVRFEVIGPVRGSVYCHCRQCLHLHGHFVAYSQAHRRDLTITDENAIHWYRASAAAQRGFCRHCGTRLFWAPDNGDAVSIASGAFDPAKVPPAVGHIFASTAPAYYTFDDGLPRFDAEWQGDPPWFEG